MKSEYLNVFEGKVSRLRYVDSRLISIDFPTERSIDSVAAALRGHHGEDDVLIINMSERVYDYDRMPGHVVSVNFRGLPSPPLEVLCRLCLQIHQWLSRSATTVVAIHCFPGYSRTAVLASCYLAWSGKYVHPMDALSSVSAALGKIGEEEDSIENLLLPSQKRYMNYFFQFLISDENEMELTRVPPVQLSMSRVVLIGLPKLPPMGDDSDGFRPFFEVWQNGQLVHSSLPKTKDILSTLPVYPHQHESEEKSVIVSMDVGIPIVIEGDVLVRVRHFTQRGGRFTCLRFAFSTNQIKEESLHLSQHEIDGNKESNCMIDVVFGKGGNQPAVVIEEDDENNESHKHIFEAAKKLSEKLRYSLFHSRSNSKDQPIDEETLLMNALHASEKLKKTSPPPEMYDMQTPQHQDEEAHPSDDVDDFFAQLERDARIQ